MTFKKRWSQPQADAAGRWRGQQWSPWLISGVWLALALWLAVSSGLLRAETPWMTVPSMGGVFDPGGKAVWSIGGVPGAAGLDRQVAIGSKVEQAWVAPGQTWALVRTVESEDLLVVSWHPAVSVRRLEGSGRAVRVIFSGTGKTAVLVGGEKAVVWTGLPEGGTAARDIEGTEILAVSDDSRVAFAAAEGARLDERALALGGPAVAADFLPGGDLAAATATELVRVNAASGEVSRLAALEGITALGLSGDGHLLVATLGRQVALLNWESGGVRLLDCGCDAQAAQRLRGNAVFLVTKGTAGMTMLDGEAAEPRLLTLAGEAQ